MAEIKYRESSNATTPPSTTVKGSVLTNLEMDGNMRSIQLDLASKATTTQLTSSVTAINDSVIAMAIALG